jgi:A/G-specific adenine glycosylase
MLNEFSEHGAPMKSGLCQQLDGIARRRWRQRLLAWYDGNARDLPWRQDRDPYHVWLSEIMLQQTRVGAVLDHYRRFLQRFPTVQKLAAAPQASVLAAWSGLGYYRRARMLHAAAKTVVKNHRGKFPHTIAELRDLPGIGRYTAAAVASIAFNAPAAVVDGNVERALGRVLGTSLAKRELWQAAEDLLSRTRPGDFNQAMMELGATVCLPREPRCSVCPVLELCATRGKLDRPAKTIPQTRKKICYALDSREGSIFLVQRANHWSLMPGMWELPEITPDGDAGRTCITLRHSITVTDYTVQVRRGPAESGTAGRWVRKERVARLPLTGLARKILRQAQVI